MRFRSRQVRATETRVNTDVPAARESRRGCRLPSGSISMHQRRQPHELAELGAAPREEPHLARPAAASRAAGGLAGGGCANASEGPFFQPKPKQAVEKDVQLC